MPNFAAGGQQSVFEWTVAESIGVWSNFEGRSTVGFSCGSFSRTRFGISLLARLQGFEIVFQVVEETHSPSRIAVLFAGFGQKAAFERAIQQVVR